MENRQLVMTIEVDQDRVNQELRKAARKVAGQYRIPGFRQGKAPYAIVAQYVGLPALFNEFVESLGEEVYKQALDQEGIEPYAPAALDIGGLEPLTYKLVVPMEPSVDLGDYRSLRLSEEEPEVNESEIEDRLEEYREQYAGWSNVDRPSEYGDMLTIDVKSVLAPEEHGEEEQTEAAGEETVVLDETDWDVTLDQDNPMEPPGLDEALLGLKPDEEKSFTLRWPEDSQSIYAGREAQFHVKVHSIQAHQKPLLDDELAQLVGPDFQTLDDLRTNIRETILEDKKKEAEDAYLDKALDALVTQSQLDYPPVVVEDQLDAMVNEFERQLRQYGIDNLDSYLAQTSQSQEEYRESLREQAEITAERNLVISELYRQEGLQVTDEEIEQRIRTMVGEPEGDEEPEDSAQSRRMVSDMMRSGAGRSILESQLLQGKTLERLLAIVRGEEIPEPVVADAAQDEAVQEEIVEDATPVAAESAEEPSASAAAADDTEEEVSAEQS